MPRHASRSAVRIWTAGAAIVDHNTVAHLGFRARRNPGDAVRGCHGAARATDRGLHPLLPVVAPACLARTGSSGGIQARAAGLENRKIRQAGDSAATYTLNVAIKPSTEQDYQERVIRTLVYIQEHLNEELPLEQ